MLQVKYFCDHADAMETAINKFLELDIQVISIIPFGVGESRYPKCQIVYVVGNNGSKLAKPNTQPFAIPDIDSFDIPRQE